MTGGDCEPTGWTGDELSDDVSRAAAIIAAEVIRKQDVSERDAVRVWRRQRARMLAKLETEPALSERDEVDDSAVFEPDDGPDDESAEWSVGDDSSQVRFPPDRVN